MLSVLRDNKKSFFGLLLVGFVAFLMVPFGMNAGGPTSGDDEVVIRVNDREITRLEYARHLDEMTDSLKQRFGPSFDSIRGMMNLEQRAVDGLIEQTVFRTLVADLNLTAGTDQLHAHLAGLPFFEKFGLTRDTYKQFLQSQRMNGQMLEARLREDLAQQQLQRTLTGLNTPIDEELRAIFREQETTYDFSLVELTPKMFEQKVVTNDEAKLKEYFTKNSASYTKPRSVRYAFVTFQPSDFMDRVELDQDELRQRYQEKQGRFYEPKQIRFRQIVLNKVKAEKSAVESLVSQGDDFTGPQTEAKRTAAKDIVERLKKGEDFGTLAKQLSEDRSTAEKGGDRGWVAPSSIEPAVSEVLDRMKTGSYSDVIETPQQFVITFLDEVKERRLKPFDEVRSQLEEELRRQDAPQYARVEAESFFDRWLSDSANRSLSLADFAAKEKRKVETTEKLLSASENPPNAPTLTQKVISLSKGERQAVKTPGFDYIVEILETKESYLPEFAELRETVTADYVKDESRKLAEAAATQALKELKENPQKSLEELAKTHGVDVKKHTAITKEIAAGLPLFAAPENKRIAFSLEESAPFPEKPLSGNNGEWTVLKLTTKKRPDEALFEQKAAEIRKKEQTAELERMGAFVSESLRAGAEVWVSPTLLTQPEAIQTIPAAF